MNVCEMNEVYSILEERKYSVNILCLLSLITTLKSYCLCKFTIFFISASQDHLEICETTSDEASLHPETKPNDGSEKHCMNSSISLQE